MDPNNPNYRPQNSQPDIFAPTNQPPEASPTQPSLPQQPPLAPNPYAQTQPDFQPPSDSGDSKTIKLLIAIIALVALFVIIAIVVFATRGAQDSPSHTAQDVEPGSFYVQEPDAVDVENVSNSIGDDVSGLNTDTDFPEDNLTDDNLGL
jgi:hypothetical protein